MALASFVVSVVVAEVAVRFLAPQPTAVTHQDRYGLALHYPGITRYLPQFGHDVTFNRAGMRDREHAQSKPDSVFRILLLGDSFMEALQVPFESSMPSMLERALPQSNGKRVEVVNAGVSGWGTDDELRYLEQYGLRYRPNVIVVAMTLHNDISDNLRQTWHTVRNDSLVEQPVQPMSAWQFGKVRLKAFVATRFQLYQLWRKVRHGGEIRRVGKALNTHVLDLFRDTTPEKIAHGFELTEHLLKAMRDTATVSGARVVVALLPIRHQLADADFNGFLGQGEVDPGEMEMTRPQQVITEIGGRLGIPVIDMLPEFRRWTAQSKGPLYMERDGHWNAEGHRLATEVVSQGLLQTGTVR